MQKLSISMSLLAVAAALGLSACGGDGSVSVASIPPPPPTPTPTPTPTSTILSAAITSQEFASRGATYVNGDRTNPLIADTDQLKLRYDAASNTYEIQLPAGSTWLAITPIAGQTGSWTTADSTVILSADEGVSTSLVYWSSAGKYGVTAVAIPTPAAAIPITGSGHYLGSLTGYSTERVRRFGSEFLVPGRIGGTISLTFDFAAGALSGQIQPTLLAFPTQVLPTLTFKDTVYSVGSPTFSGKFDTTLSGLNSFSGLFAGPAAGEVAGNFAFPYLSPKDGTAQQASGAFTGQHQ